MNRHAHTSRPRGRPRSRPRSRPTSLRAPLLWAALAALLLAATACASSTTSTTSSSSSREDPAGAGAARPRPPSAALRYVALGDSYSSAPLVPVTDVADGCFRSSANYPSLVARKLGVDVEDRSCASARTPDLIRGQRAGVPPQIEAVTADTDLVTIGVGGNDESVFTRLVGECPRLRASDPSGAPCRERMSAGGRDELLAALNRTSGRIRSVAARVHDLAPDAKVLLVGYPHIVAAGSTCRDLPLAAGDYAYAEQVNRALTEAVRRAAKATDSTYVDVWGASRGHDICSDEPWINGSVTDQRRAAAFHPFAVEQAAVADLVVAAAS